MSLLRVLQVVCTDNFAGVERYLTYTAPELARRGHDVVVIGGDPVRMPAELADTGVGWVPGARVGAAALAIARAERPDVVHVHMTAAETAAALAWPVVRRPVVATMHFARPRGGHGPKRRVYRVLEPVVRRQIAISSFVADAVGGRCTVIPNGVPVPPHPAPGGEPVVLVAQRLEAEKATGLAVRAWAASGLGAEGWRLDVAGKGSERPALEALAAATCPPGSFRFLGQVDDLERRLAGAGLLLAPSAVDGFGLSVAEAMAVGLPVAAADGGAHPELVADGRQLFEPGSPVAAARLLRALATDPELRHELGTANRSRCQEQYTVARHVDRLEALYAAVV